MALKTELCFSAPAKSDIFQQVDISFVARIFISLVVLRNEGQKYRAFFPGLILYEGRSLVSRKKLVFCYNFMTRIVWSLRSLGTLKWVVRNI